MCGSGFVVGIRILIRIHNTAKKSTNTGTVPGYL